MVFLSEEGDKAAEGDGDMEFDTRSEASSDHQFTDDEPSMSEASRASSISRESSGKSCFKVVKIPLSVITSFLSLLSCVNNKMF